MPDQVWALDSTIWRKEKRDRNHPTKVSTSGRKTMGNLKETERRHDTALSIFQRWFVVTVW
jgi:hypothetical protein